MSIIERGKFLALILRHKPETIKISLDENGWADVKQMIQNSDFSKKELEEIVDTDDKDRYEFNSNKTLIRACQGHSVKVDIQFSETVPPEFLYHGTKKESQSSIYKRGLIPMSRQYIHLSLDIKTAQNVAARRKGESVILTINAQEMYKSGFKFYISSNGVWLISEVPPKFIQGISTFFIKD